LGVSSSFLSFLFVVSFGFVFSSKKFAQSESAGCTARGRTSDNHRHIRDTHRTHDLGLSFLWFVSLFQIGCETIERAFPELSIFFHPLGGFLERLRVQLHLVHSPVTTAAEKSGSLQDA
jgi:hypothetical protein